MSTTEAPAPQVSTFADLDQLVDAAARQFVELACSTLDSRPPEESFNVVFTGGTAGIATLRRIAELDAASRAQADNFPIASIDWSRVQVFFGDERDVAVSDPESNEGQAREALLDHVDIPESNIHGWGLDGSTEELVERAVAYAETLLEFAPNGFDLHLLGMGHEGHINSLFPGSAATKEQGALTMAVTDSPKPPACRGTLTFPAINSADHVWLLISGSQKAEAASQAIAGADRNQWPVGEARGRIETTVFISEDAQSAASKADVAARADNVVKRYGKDDTAVTALGGVNIEFHKGEFTAIMGPSGSGKSTLMHCMAGLDSVTEGHTYIGDTDLSTLKDKQITTLRRDRLGFVFQSFNLVPTLSAAENITLPVDIAGRKVDEQWFKEVTTRLGLDKRLKHRPNELSGGQQQRVAVARALISRPEIIFGDEPTGNLDSNASSEVLGILRAAVDDLGQTVVIVTHDPKAASYADRVVFLADGQLVEDIRQPSVDDILKVMAKIEEV